MNKQDWQEYKSYLHKQITVENRKQDSIAKFFNLSNLYLDLNGLKL